MQILLTNDDGVHAPGLSVLRRALEGLGEISTIAPDHNASAVARGITTDRALRLSHVAYGDGWAGLACDGTPCDCVRIGLLGVVTPPPDLVVAGVNAGPNMGADVTYSGTVGAAFEAALRGLPAIAFSVDSREPRSLETCGALLRALTERVVESGLPHHSFLNVNLPDLPLSDIVGVRSARLGGASCHDRVLLEGQGEAGASSQAPGDYVVTCDDPVAGEWADTDFEVVVAGFVAVTPLRADLLDVEQLARLSSWDLDLERLNV